MIYCVEDDQGIRDLMVYTLNASGFDAKGFKDASELYGALKVEKPELITLDIMLPKEDGISILRKIKDDDNLKNIPIIMASAKGEEYDKVLGLDLGADDYLAKPFGMMEMVSRVKAVLRRSGNIKNSKDIYSNGDISLNNKQHLVLIKNEKIDLTAKEYDLLELFISNIGIVFSRDELLSKIWGLDFIGESRTIDVHVGTLRSKLGLYGKCIKTLRGVGYKMEELDEK